jgi:F0F1-type ATP synthase assembly protein I
VDLREQRARRELNNGFGDALSRAFELAATPAIFGGIGWLLDRWLGTRFLVAVGIVVGMAGAFYLIIKRYGSG